MQIRFTKMQGLGNDFVVLDACSYGANIISSAPQIAKMADRHFGVGFDQLLVIEPANKLGVDFNYRVFNADGSEAGQSGNGARCVAKYVVTHGLTAKRELIFSIQGHQVKMRFEDDQQITVVIGKPITDPAKIPFKTFKEALRYALELEDSIVEIGAVSVGNPHAVLLVNDIATAQVATLGPMIENHPLFPARVNVNFMQVVDRNTIKLRVYERGTGETLACGSGACASVVVGRLWNLLDQKVTVKFPAGDLIVSWENREAPVLLTGPAEEVFSGELLLQ